MNTGVEFATPEHLVWRVGRAPEPWAWPPNEYIGDGRWDDVDGGFRTVYAGDSRYSCFVEVLAPFRPDPTVTRGLNSIIDDGSDREWPTQRPGCVPRVWVAGRRISSATLTGEFADVTAASTIAALRPQFITMTRALGLPDFDAAAVKLAFPRTLTQELASWLYQQRSPDGLELVAGIRFASRHGDDLGLWAVFERPGDLPFSRRLTIDTEAEIMFRDPDLVAAFQLHNLVWG